MKKVTIFLGRNIHDLEVCVEFPVAGKAYFHFPEMDCDSGHFYPLHATRYVPRTLKKIVSSEHDVVLVTQSSDLVNAIGAAISEGKLLGGKERSEIRLYADDNQSYRSFYLTEEGVISDCWPYGWFLSD